MFEWLAVFDFLFGQFYCAFWVTEAKRSRYEDEHEETGIASSLTAAVRENCAAPSWQFGAAPERDICPLIA